MIPSAILFPQYAQAFNSVSARLSLAAGVLLSSLLAEVQVKRQEKVALALSALLFFGFVFRDEWKLNLMEDQLNAAVAQLPRSSRVIGFLRVRSKWINPLLQAPLVHAVDRACVGHCFSYANYEPSTRQFRVRAEVGNSIVMADYEDVSAVERDRYIIQARDLPVFFVYSCGSDGLQVCSHELR
jgi:hypothetical protein